MIRILRLKKALISGAFFGWFSLFACVVILVVFGRPAYAGLCSTSHLPGKSENARVKWVYDADTLLLSDKRKIRIIGINAPEVSHHHQSAEAYGAKAREALRALLKKSHYQIRIQYGRERHDRYHRDLAHVFLPNGTDVSVWLLEKGFAKTMAIPPNIALANCYRQAERVAQRQSLRIWQLKSSQLKQADSLPLRTKGYVRLHGRVKQLVFHKKSLSFELAVNSNRPITIKIKKRNLRYFNGVDLDRLAGREIKVTGILLKKHGKRIIYVSYPSQLEVLETKKTKSTIEWSQVK